MTSNKKPRQTLTINLVRLIRTIGVAVTQPSDVYAIPRLAHELCVAALMRRQRLLGTSHLVRTVKTVDVPVASPSVRDALAVEAHEFRFRTGHVGWKVYEVRDCCVGQCLLIIRPNR